MDDDNVSVMDKKPEDLTVGEALKINLGITAIGLTAMVAIPVVVGLGITGYEKLRDKVRARKDAKLTLVAPTE